MNEQRDKPDNKYSSELKLFHLVLLVLFSCFGHAQVEMFSLDTFSTGYTRPVAIAYAGGDDPRLFIVEQRGRIYICDSLGNKSATPFLDISAKVSQSGNERGLLGLAFHPDYSTNGYFFVSYTQSNGGSSVLERYMVSNDPDLADSSSHAIYLTIAQPYSNHNGGDIHFGPDGYLYYSLGDGGSAGDPLNSGQTKSSLLGKILRMDVDQDGYYTVPSDNPFVDSTGYAPEIWDLGLRNPWRFSFDRVTGDKWIADVGQNAWEEINFEGSTESGKNYGWRCYEGNSSYNTSGCGAMTSYNFPVFVYPNNGTTGCSVTGGYRYRGTKYKNWWGSYIHTDYCSGKFWETRGTPGSWNTTEIEDLNDFEFSAFGQDRYGELYVAGLAGGVIYRLRDTTSIPKAFIAELDTARFCGQKPILHAFKGEGFSYQWFEDGLLLPGRTYDTLCISSEGNFSVEVTALSGQKDTSAIVVAEICDFTQCLEQDIYLSQWLIDQGITDTLRSSKTIIADGAISVADSFFLFAAESIILDPNLTVANGGLIEAQIQDCSQ